MFEMHSAHHTITLLSLALEHRNHPQTQSEDSLPRNRPCKTNSSCLYQAFLLPKSYCQWRAFMQSLIHSVSLIIMHGSYCVIYWAQNATGGSQQQVDQKAEGQMAKTVH